MSLINLKLVHWTTRIDSDGIVWLGLDKKDSSVNVLSQPVLQELQTCIENLEKSVPTGLIIYSEKNTSFIAGADINEFTQFSGENEVYEYIRSSQTLFDRIETIACPTIALIDGICLGGGLELAMACQYRIACDDDKTRLGLPEVNLGIHPGFGGTVRLPGLVGVFTSMNMMLVGRPVSARAARKIGLVDYTTPRRHLLTAAVQVVKNPPKKPRLPLINKLLSLKPVRPLVATLLTKKVSKKVSRKHYPAPFAIIELWKNHSHDKDVMTLKEAKSISKLLVSETAQNLVRIFFLQEKLKAQGNQSDFRAKQVHVVGAGVMGGDIAAWCALKGLKVTLQDRSAAVIAPAIKRAYQLFKRRLKKPRLIQQAMDQLIPDEKGLGVKEADIIIEAIYENKEAKHALYKVIEPQMKEGALLVSNTSSIPLEELGTALKFPNRLVGLHFFNPVAQMMLIEIVSTQQSDPDSVKAVAAFARQIGKLPLPVQSTPGFLINRILMPYLLEAVELLAEGVAPETIDAVAIDFGMKMGPVELADTVGLDICLSVAEILSQRLGGKVPQLLKDKVVAKELGKKSGIGFYRYKNAKLIRNSTVNDDKPDKVIRERLVFRLLNEAMTCLREKVVSSSDLLDAGIVYGTGFAPFRGGPMHYSEKIGFETQIEHFKELEQAFGDRFHPDSGWDSVKKAS